MYSKARVAGYPIHPMLVAFPIAFYTATVAMLLAYIGTLEAFWYRVAMVAAVAGIVTALIAVVPGAIDLFALPRTSHARAVGLRHAGFNLLAGDASKEVTITGNMVCGKCTLHETTSCQNVIQVEKDLLWVEQFE